MEGDAEAPPKWDVFVSYASEDRAEVAKPLVDLLTGWGLRVWYDQATLEIGDSLRRSIDQGLARCRYAVVILSHSFFKKHYPNRELDGLTQREVDGRDVILPVWHGVTAADVRKFSAPLADRVASATSEGIDAVARKIARVVLGPERFREIELAAQIPRELPIVASGRELISIVGGAHSSVFGHEKARDESETELIARFIELCTDCGDLLGTDSGPAGWVRAQSALDDELATLREAGWQLHGKRQRTSTNIANQQLDDWYVVVLFVARLGTRISWSGERFVVLPARQDTEAAE